MYAYGQDKPSSTVSKPDLTLANRGKPICL